MAALQRLLPHRSTRSETACELFQCGGNFSRPVASLHDTAPLHFAGSLLALFDRR